MKNAPAPFPDATTWLRIKEHVADLSELDPEARQKAFDALSLTPDDRLLLAKLLPFLSIDELRLREPVPRVSAIPVDLPLRWSEGDLIGSYVVEGFLGRGGMGEVYEARPVSGGAPVALKILRAGLEHASYTHISDNEQRALQRLDDERISRFLEAFPLEDGGSCLVLELVAGEPLLTFCRSRRFSVEARLKLFIEVCHAIASAHRQLVVHRDLKPSNVLVTIDGHVKLLDFGVAKLLDAQDGGHTQGMLCTLEYAAPEQVLREQISVATDIYSMGVLLYQLLTDVSPYERADKGQLIYAVLNDAPQSLAAGLLRSSAQGHSPSVHVLDRDLDTIIERAMEKDPRQRYVSAMELSLDIQAVIDGRPIAKGGGALYRYRKFLRRHRTRAAASVVAILSLLAATTVSLHSAYMTAHHAHRAEVARDFLLTALDVTDVYSPNNRRDLSLDDVLTRAVDRARAALIDEPQVRSDVLGKLGEALEHRGKLKAALDASSEANAIRQNDPGRDMYEYAAGLNALASIEMSSSQLDSAHSHLLESMRLSLTKTLRDKRPLISAYAGLSRLSSLRGDARSALDWDGKVIELRRAVEGDDSAELAMDYNRQGTSFILLYRYPEASEAFRRGLAIIARRLGNMHPRYGVLSYGYAVSLVGAGQFDQARVVLTQAQAALVDADGHLETSPFGAASQRLHAQLDYLVGNYIPAQREVESMISATRTISPVTLGNSLILKGKVELALGKLPEALRDFDEAQRQFAENGRPQHPQRWLAAGLGGAVRCASGECQEGEANLEHALAMLDETIKPAGIEHAELLVYSGAAARERGESAIALQRHRRAQEIQQRTGWMGIFGQAIVDAEIAQDALKVDGPSSGREQALALLESSVVALKLQSPGDFRLPKLIALLEDSGKPVRVRAGGVEKPLPCTGCQSLQAH